ncbi:MAG: DUF2513 domain-containing protein [Campylobacterales bacterium]|nr:DUF2513 domain-containing protein [Campylobacterales bacterium]
MKRDLDLIRDIMLTLEEKMDYGQNISSEQLFEIMKNDMLSIKKLTYHIGLLVEANYIKAKELKTYSDGSIFTINTITFDGQDFIDALRDSKIWNEVKGKFSEIGSSALSVMIDLGKDYLKKQIGL